MSWPVSCVQNGNIRLVREAASIPALTLAVGAQPDCVAGTTNVGNADGEDGGAGADAADVVVGTVADISLSSWAYCCGHKRRHQGWVALLLHDGRNIKSVS